ncbi:hypothetical protein L7F22_036437 [Adiantum nelumboides]|nr:hypothetical protein [Adiantum nelumboides]
MIRATRSRVGPMLAEEVPVGVKEVKGDLFLLVSQPMDVNKRKAKANAKEKEGTTVPEQHIVKKLKKVKKAGVCEVAFEQKLAIDEGKVKGHMGKGQLEKVREDKIALKRDGMKKKGKKHVEKGLKDKGLADRALALVGSSKRPKLQLSVAIDGLWNITSAAELWVVRHSSCQRGLELVPEGLLQGTLQVVGMIAAASEAPSNPTSSTNLLNSPCGSIALAIHLGSEMNLLGTDSIAHKLLRFCPHFVPA